MCHAPDTACLPEAGPSRAGQQSIVACGRYASGDAVARARRRAYLTKPLDLNELPSLVDEILGERGARPAEPK